MFKLLNEIRRDHHLPQFRYSVALRSAAREHSADMLTRHYFEHNSPGETFDHRIRRHLDDSLVGGAFAWGTSHYATPEGLVKLWMTSPTHRHIILMRSLHRIGLGVAIGTFSRQPGRSHGNGRLRRLSTGTSRARPLTLHPAL